MTLRIDIPADVKEVLDSRANEAGLSREEYVQRIVMESVEDSTETRSTSAAPFHPRAKNLAELFRHSPFRGLEMEFERDRDAGRELDL